MHAAVCLARAGIAWVAIAMALPALCAATFVVTNTNDAGPGSLRQAILDANAQVGPHTVDATTLTGAIELATPLPTIVQQISINGPGSSTLTLTREPVVNASRATDRMFHVANTGTLTLSGFQIGSTGFIGWTFMAIDVGGSADVSMCTIQHTGGVESDGGLTLRDCVVRRNMRHGHGGFLRSGFANPNTQLLCQRVHFEQNMVNPFSENPGAYSGTTGVVQGQGSATFEDCTFLRNTSFGGSAGAIVWSSSLKLERCVFRDNGGVWSSPGSPSGPGAVQVVGEFLCIDSIFDSNVGERGALRMIRCQAVIEGTTFVNNKAVHPDGHGGALADAGSAFEIRNCTFTGNTAGAAGRGGGLFLTNMSNPTAGLRLIVNCTVTLNEAPGGGGGYYSDVTLPVELQNNVIAGNRSPGASTPDVDGGAQPFVSAGFNLIGNIGTAAVTPGPSDQFGTSAAPLDAQLGPLRYHGGITPAHMPMLTSPLIDAGGASATILYDQRQVSRPFDLPGLPNAAQGNGNDIGSIERAAAGTITAHVGELDLSAPLAGTPSAPAVLDVAADGALAFITATVPAPFEISLSYSGGYGNAVNTPAPVGGMVPATTLYIRYNPAAGPRHAAFLELTCPGCERLEIRLIGRVEADHPPLIEPCADVIHCGAGIQTPWIIWGTNLRGPVTVTTTGSSSAFALAEHTSAPSVPSVTTSPPVEGFLMAVVWVRYTSSPSIMRDTGTLLHESLGAAPRAVLAYGAPDHLLHVSKSELSMTTTALLTPSATVTCIVNLANVPASGVTVSTSAPFEVSLNPAVGFGTQVTIPKHSNPSYRLPPTTVYFRYSPVAGFVAGGTALFAASGVAPVYVALKGEVLPPPTTSITTSTASLNIISHSYSNPSSPVSYTVAGSSLGAPITVSAPLGFTVSLTSSGGFGSQVVTAAPVSGVVPATDIYVRYTASPPGLSGGTLLHTSGTETATMAVRGTYLPAGIGIHQAPLEFSTPAPFQPSAERSYTLYGSQLTGPISITAPGPFEVSFSPGSGFAQSLVSPSPTGGIVGPLEVYVRFTPHYEAQHGGVIAHSTPGRPDVRLTVRGAIVVGATRLAGQVQVSAASMHFVTTAFNQPTAPQSYDVSGTDLQGAVNVSVPAPFEVSLSPGSGFAAKVATPPPVAGVLGPTTIYVRFNPTEGIQHAGAAANFSFSAGAAAVSLTGDVNLPPSVQASVASLSFSTLGFSPSPEQAYSISGSSLTGPVSIQVPAPFELSFTGGGPYSQSVLSAAPVGGVVGPLDVFVRYNPAAGTSHVASIDHDSPGAVTVVVAVDGTVLPPGPIGVSATSLSFTTHATGTPSAEQSYLVSGTMLGTPVVVTVSAPFEVSLTPGAGFGLSVVTAPPTAGVVPPTTVYVRYNPTSGTSHAGTADHDSSGLPTVIVTLDGTVVPPGPIVVSASALTFITPAHGVASPAQSYTLEGSNLLAPITITAGLDFEVSWNATSGFGPSLVTNAPTAGAIGPVAVYVRYIPAAGTAHSTTIDHTSSGAQPEVVNVTGSVVPTPVFQLSAASLVLQSPGVGQPSGELSYTVSGDHLTADVQVAAPAEFEVSLTSGSGFSGSLSIPASGVLPPTTIYVRYVPSAGGGHAATLTHSSPGAQSVGIALHGEVVAKVTPPGKDSPGCATGRGSTWSVVLWALPAMIAARLRRKRPASK